MSFTQAPPGLAGLLLAAPLVHELAREGIPVGWIFSYKPDAPQKDLIFLTCCFEVPVDVRYATGRLMADTDRAVRHASGRWTVGAAASAARPTLTSMWTAA